MKKQLLILSLFFSLSQETLCMKKTSLTLKKLGEYFTSINNLCNKNIILFIGPPASGKGTISKKTILQLGWDHISTGTLCRKEIEKQTPIGLKIEKKIKSGTLVDDDTIIILLSQALQQINNTVILDGFPRTRKQAEALDTIIKNDQLALKVVLLTANEQFILEYSTNRWMCKDCQKAYIPIKHSPCIPKAAGICDICSSELIKRCDDTKDTVLKRLKNFYDYESQLISYYKEHDNEIIQVAMESTDLNPLDKQFEEFKKALQEK